jgi:TRAP transporter TAXI family solute receptor
VRARLITLLVLLMGSLLAALTVPFAQDMTGQRQQVMFADRLQDTIGIASAAAEQLDVSRVDDQELGDDISRYADLYGIGVAVISHTGTVQVVAGPDINFTGADVEEAIASGLAGHQSADPPIVWPWSTRAMVVVVPVIRNNDVIGAALTVSSTARLRATAGLRLVGIGLIEVISLILLAALALRLARWVLRPVYVLDGAAHEISSGRLATRIRTDQGPVELRRLGTSFNRMARAVERAMERQRAFVADASHQLRNPLSALLLRLDALGVGLDPMQREELDLVRDEAGRLVEILDELLNLATAQHVSADPVEVDLDALVGARFDAWRAMGDRRGVRLCSPPAATGPALVDPVLFGSALDAVLDNAIKFSPPGGTVEVGVLPDGADIRVDVRDQGPGLSAEELARVGDRFWRSASSQNVPGCGLGLSIARTLLDATGGRLRFAPAEGGGLRVSLSVPRAVVSAENRADSGPEAHAEIVADPELPLDRPSPAASAAALDTAATGLPRIVVAARGEPGMRLTRRTILIGGGTAAVAGCGWALANRDARSRSAPPRPPIVIATGDTEGVYYQYAQAFLDAIAQRLGPVQPPVITTGSVDNLNRLGRGKVSFAFVTADAAAGGYQRSAAPMTRLRAVARLYEEYLHLVVPSDSPITDLYGLAGRRVSLGPDNSGTRLIVDRILAASAADVIKKIIQKPLSINDSVTALERGEIDAFFWSGGVPTEGVSDLAKVRPVRLVDLSAAADKIRTQFGPWYQIGTILGGTYVGVSATRTLAVPTMLVTTSGADAGRVTALTAALFDNADTIARAGVPEAAQLDIRTAIFTEPIPLHEGAREYYRTTKPQV